MQPIGETGIDPHFITWLLVFTVSVVLFFWIAHQIMAVRRARGPEREHVPRVTFVTHFPVFLIN